MGILTDDMKRLIRQQRLGFIATVSPDGTPDLSPKGSTTVWNDDHVIFADIRSAGTVANLRRNPAVEINVVDPIVRKGYRFKGKARILTSGQLFEKILSHYEQDELEVQNGLAKRIRAIVLVKVNRALPLISPAYDLGLTEEEVSARWEKYWDTRKKSW